MSPSTRCLTVIHFLWKNATKRAWDVTNYTIRNVITCYTPDVVHIVRKSFSTAKNSVVVLDEYWIILKNPVILLIWMSHSLKVSASLEYEEQLFENLIHTEYCCLAHPFNYEFILSFIFSKHWKVNWFRYHINHLLFNHLLLPYIVRILQCGNGFVPSWLMSSLF